MNKSELEDMMALTEIAWEDLDLEEESEIHESVSKNIVNILKEKFNQYKSHVEDEFAKIQNHSDSPEPDTNSLPEQFTLENLRMKREKILNNMRQLEEKKKFYEKNILKARQEREKLENKSKRIIFTKVQKYYETMFGCTVSFDNKSDHVYELGIQFDKGPIIKLTMNNSDLKIIDFDASAICSKEEEAKLKDQLKHLSNPQLMVQLRELALKRNKN